MLKHWLKELIMAISKNKFVGVIGLGNMGGGIQQGFIGDMNNNNHYYIH